METKCKKIIQVNVVVVAMLCCFLQYSK